MVDQVRSFIEQELSEVAKQFPDFTPAKVAAVRREINRCAKDFEFPLEKPVDTNHENFNYFALCLRNAVNLNPSLNNSPAVRKSVLGWDF
jgi:hypothetical protein